MIIAPVHALPHLVPLYRQDIARTSLSLPPLHHCHCQYPLHLYCHSSDPSTLRHIPSLCPHICTIDHLQPRKHHIQIAEPICKQGRPSAIRHVKKQPHHLLRAILRAPTSVSETCLALTHYYLPQTRHYAMEITKAPHKDANSAPSTPSGTNRTPLLQILEIDSRHTYKDIKAPSGKSIIVTKTPPPSRKPFQKKRM